MIIVVGGSSRKAGKTTVICDIIEATREANWTAIKITPHIHEPKDYGDTERYLAAGASRAIFIQDKQTTQIPTTGNVIIESNSILDKLTPDLFVFVDGGQDWKPSAERHAKQADYVVGGQTTPDLIARIRSILSEQQS